MVRLGSGLIITEQLTQRNVHVDMSFQPSVGILARKLDKLGLDIRSFREPLKESVQKVIIPSIRRNFDAGGRPKWTPLAVDTVKQKGGDARPLIRSGLLRRRMGHLNIWDITIDSAMISNLPPEIWYGALHQAGHGSSSVSIKNVSTGKMDVFTEASGGSLPARPFVTLMPGDITKIERVFERWLAKRVRMAGLS